MQRLAGRKIEKLVAGHWAKGKGRMGRGGREDGDGCGCARGEAKGEETGRQGWEKGAGHGGSLMKFVTILQMGRWTMAPPYSILPMRSKPSPNVYGGNKGKRHEEVELDR